MTLQASKVMNWTFLKPRLIRNADALSCSMTSSVSRSSRISGVFRRV